MPSPSEPKVFLIPEGVLVASREAMLESVPQFKGREWLGLWSALAALVAVDFVGLQTGTGGRLYVEHEKPGAPEAPQPEPKEG